MGGRMNRPAFFEVLWDEHAFVVEARFNVDGRVEALGELRCLGHRKEGFPAAAQAMAYAVQQIDQFLIAGFHSPNPPIAALEDLKKIFSGVRLNPTGELVRVLATAEADAVKRADQFTSSLGETRDPRP
ncbi:hypothetical protein [Maricaulis maris]|uniref:hypothetical protein n=1 Tax=Maricaulis maris TaxID=74318 RepID=UPI003B8C7807